LTRLQNFLRRHRRIALDTSPFIYQLENDSRYSAITDRIFKWIEQSNIRLWWVAPTLPVADRAAQLRAAHIVEQTITIDAFRHAAAGEAELGTGHFLNAA
jgi:hypothetical protein